MKILKDRGNYLENKISCRQENNVILFILLIFGGIGAFLGFTINNYILTVSSVLLMIIGGVIYKNYCKDVNACQKGITGEEKVISALKNLDDKYYLINDITLQQPYGNIDHILLGPNGIFVIETKNYNGIIECDGDEWHRLYESRKGPRYFMITSPSKQVKRNAVGLKKFLSEVVDIVENKPYLFINGVLVFTEHDVDLKLNNPTVPVLKAEKLPDYINDFKTNNQFTNDELKSIAKLIIDASK